MRRYKKSPVLAATRSWGKPNKSLPTLYSTTHGLVKGNSTIEQCYESLGNRVVALAVWDYRKAMRRLKRDPDCEQAKSEARSLERFFLSERFGIFTTLDGEYLLGRLKECLK